MPTRLRLDKHVILYLNVNHLAMIMLRTAFLYVSLKKKELDSNFDYIVLSQRLHIVKKSNQIKISQYLLYLIWSIE